MSKKSRKNPSKPAASKVAKRASTPVAKKAAKTAAKTVAKKATKPATKSPAKKAAAKPAKPAKKTVAKTVVKAAKPAKAPAGKPADSVKKTTATKAPPKAATEARAKSASTPAAKPTTTPKSSADKVSPAAAPRIAVEGAKAPAFELPRDGGATVSLSDYAGQKLVIFFYPRASTPGCTKEAIDFTRLSDDFRAAGVAVLGVSADPLKAQESFRDKYSLGVPLLSDATQDMLKSYGAWGEKSMYGKIFEGVLRTTVLIAADGTVAKIWRGVKVDGHADAVLEETRRI